MNNFKVSIIIPIYNVEKYISSCIESCINQIYRNIEIICINDCSTDESGKIVAQMLDTDNRIKLIENLENCGVFFTKDKGAKCAKGDFLFFLDGDDYLPATTIENLLNKTSNNVDIVAGNMEFVSEDTNELLSISAWPAFKTLTKNEFLGFIIKLNRWSQCGMLIRKSIYDRIIFLPFDVKIREDALIMLQLCNYADRVVTINETVYFYIQRQSSALHKHKTVDERALEDFTYASKATQIIDKLSNISKVNEYLIRSELIKELSWTLNSRIILKENKGHISDLIKAHLLTRGMFKYIFKNNGIKSFAMYIASYFYPQFWIWATEVNKKRLYSKTKL